MGTVLELARSVPNTAVVYRHEGPVPERGLPSTDASVSWIDRELTDDVVAPERRRERFHDLLDVGHSGLLAYERDSWISYGWICTPSSSRTPLSVPDWVGELEVYWTFNDRTSPEYRRRGWHAFLLAERLRAIYDHEPDADVYTDAAIDNPSRFSMVSLGFEPSGRLTTYRLGHPELAVRKVGRWNPTAPHPPLPDVK